MEKQTHSVLVASKDELTTRAAHKVKDSTFDKIYRYYHDKSVVQLSDGEEKIRARWEKAWLLLGQANNQKSTADFLVKLFGGSRSRAHYDVVSAMMLFGSPQSKLKDAKRAIAETMILKGAKRAWKNKDLGLYDKFLQKYIDINGIALEQDGDMKELIPNLKPHTIVFVSDANQLQKQADELLKNVPSVDTTFEDVTDEEEEAEG